MTTALKMTKEELFAMTPAQRAELPRVNMKCVESRSAESSRCRYCVGCVGCTDCIGCEYCKFCERCIDCTDCEDCQDCTGIANAKHQRYVAYGLQLSGADYRMLIEETRRAQ